MKNFIAGLVVGLLLVLIGAGWIEPVGGDVYRLPTAHRATLPVHIPELRVDRLVLGEVVLSQGVTLATTGPVFDLEALGRAPLLKIPADGLVLYQQEPQDWIHVDSTGGITYYDATSAPAGAQ